MQQSQDQDVWFCVHCIAVAGLEVEGQRLHFLEYHTYAESDKNAHRLHLAVLQPVRENLSVTQHFFLHC